MGKIILANLVFLLAVVGACRAAQYGGGTGEPNDPYLIYDANHMNAVGADANKHFKLMADIDLSDFNGLGGNPAFNIIGNDFAPFSGVFDGNGHQISNLNVNCEPFGSELGLFGVVDGGGEIRDLTLVDPNVGGSVYCHSMGALAGSQGSESVISNCHVRGGRISGAFGVGGLVGDSASIIVDCSSSAYVTGEYGVGVLIGIQWEGIVLDCSAEGSVLLIAMPGVVYTTGGGLVGETNGGTILRCYSGGTVRGQMESEVGGMVGRHCGDLLESYSTATVVGDDTSGGLVSSNQGRIIDCYAMGRVESYDYFAGGLASHNGGIIRRCYSTGLVEGLVTGGLVGANVWEGARIEDCYWDTESSGQTEMCGGEYDDASGCDDSGGKATEEMWQESTFSGWDFEDVWTICDRLGYPKFRWQSPPGPIQSAIDAAADGETIVIPPGTYNENINFKGKNLVLKSENPNDPAIVAATIINGDDNCNAVSFSHNEGSNCILDGFTITGATLGIYTRDSAPTIKNCVIRANAGNGLELHEMFERSSPAILNCSIIDNGGAGIVFVGRNYSDIINCVIAGNGWYGILTRHTRVANCTIGGNKMAGLYSNTTGSVVTNSILWDNNEGQAQLESYSSACKPTVTYSNVQGEWEGTGNIDSDPCFVSAGYWADIGDANIVVAPNDPNAVWKHGDYHLQSQAGRWDPNSNTWITDANTSSCIDAGDLGSDWTAELWPHGKRINMGAFGGTSQASMSLSSLGNRADLNNDDIVNLWDFARICNMLQVEGVLLAEDIDRNNRINKIDVSILINNWLWQ